MSKKDQEILEYQKQVSSKSSSPITPNKYVLVQTNNKPGTPADQFFVSPQNLKKYVKDRQELQKSRSPKQINSYKKTGISLTKDSPKLLEDQLDYQTANNSLQNTPSKSTQK